MRLWLVRHGSTDWSARGRLCGWADVPLNEDGRIQAEVLRARLGHQAFDGVWASDLARCVEFARIAFGDATSDQRLRELDFGRLEGKTWTDLDSGARQRLMSFEGFVAPGGESVEQLDRRVRSFLAELTDGDHLVFTHGGVIRLLARRRGEAVTPGPGELNVLEWVGRRNKTEEMEGHR